MRVSRCSSRVYSSFFISLHSTFLPPPVSPISSSPLPPFFHRPDPKGKGKVSALTNSPGIKYIPVVQRPNSRSSSSSSSSSLPPPALPARWVMIFVDPVISPRYLPPCIALFRITLLLLFILRVLSSAGIETPVSGRTIYVCILYSVVNSWTRVAFFFIAFSFTWTNLLFVMNFFSAIDFSLPFDKGMRTNKFSIS